MSEPPVVELRPTCLVVCPGITYDEWVGAWQSLDQTSRSINWLVGDCLTYGESAFPDQWSQVVEAQYAELYKRALWVSSRIPPAERRESLSWSAHRATAALDAPERTEIFDLAEANGWGSREIVEEIKRRKAAPPYPSNGAPPDPDPPAGEFHVESAPDTFGDVCDIEGLETAPPEPPQAQNGFERHDDAAGLSAIPSPAQGDEAEAIRRLIAAVRHLAPSLSPDWRFGATVERGGQTTVKLTKGEQLAIGIGPSLPCALVEAALSALLSEISGIMAQIPVTKISG